jgi:hypothetical protein
MEDPYGLPDKNPAHFPKAKPAVVRQLACRHRRGDGLRKGRGLRMDDRRPHSTRPQKNVPAAIDDEKKTDGSMLENIESIFDQWQKSFGQKRVFERAKADAMSALVGFGRRTLTGIISTSGRQHFDWTSDFRIFSHSRFRKEGVFDAIRGGIVEMLEPGEAVVAAIDDTLLKKTGKKTPGVKYRRDPMGPPFHINFIRGQRFIQISMALHEGTMPGHARMIPVNFLHAPTPLKPRPNARAEDWERFRREQKDMNICKTGASMIHSLRNALNLEPSSSGRRLLMTGDGSYTNGKVLKNLPENTTFIGRIRKDAAMFFPPVSSTELRRGRKLVYGDKAPTPDQLRLDASVPWQTCEVWAAGALRTFYVKTIAPLRTRMMGPKDVYLIVVKPLAYKLSKNSRTQFREPAYIICTDTNLSLQQALQAYVWRWDIEVNFRDEKQIIGVGQAQVRNESSVDLLPSLLVAAYSALLLAGAKTFGVTGLTEGLPPPAWRRNQTKQRASTFDLVSRLRADLWGQALRIDNFSGFSSHTPSTMNPRKFIPHLPSAVFYSSP